MSHPRCVRAIVEPLDPDPTRGFEPRDWTIARPVPHPGQSVRQLGRIERRRETDAVVAHPELDLVDPDATGLQHDLLPRVDGRDHDRAASDIQGHEPSQRLSWRIHCGPPSALQESAGRVVQGTW